MTELKYSIESLNSRLGQAEEGITKFKGRSFEIVHSEKKKKVMKNTHRSYGTPLRKTIYILLESEKNRGRKG